MSGLPLYLFCLLLVLSAVLSVEFKDNLSSVIALSAFSVLLTAVFIALRAPDVAMAEAVVSTGFLTALFVVTVNKVRGEGQ